MTLAAVCLLIIAALLRTRYGRLKLALWLLMCGNVLIEAADHIMERRK